jgi:DNA-binding NarL/FixJ family response regulator
MSAAVTAAGEQVKVLIVDDQRAFVESLAIVIDAQDDLACVGIARSGSEAVSEAASRSPDVVLMDVGLPGIDGVGATEQIVAAIPGVRVIILTGRADAPTLVRAAAAGASAFLLKSSSVGEILDAVRQPSTGRLEIDPVALGAFVSDGGPLAARQLTGRELEVLGLLAEGRQPKQVARELGITVTTCRGYIKSLFQKLGAHSALEAVVVAHRHGVIRLPEPLG